MYIKLESRPGSRLDWWQTAFISCWLISCLLGQSALLYAQTGSEIKLKSKNQLTADWLVFKPDQNRLTIYLPDYHGPVNALYQWVDIRPGQPFTVTFTARRDLCILPESKISKKYNNMHHA